jgi:hypothetical protein
VSLTVIVCTIPERRSLLSRCLWYLEHQTVTDFEVIVAHGPQGKGTKLARAFPLVETSHVMVVDDDDWISPLLVESVLPFREDWVGYDAVQFTDGRFDRKLTLNPGSHICPTRIGLALEAPFGDEYSAAYDYTDFVASKAESTSYIVEPFYFYDKWNAPGGEWSPPRNVGMWPHDKSLWRWA